MSHFKRIAIEDKNKETISIYLNNIQKRSKVRCITFDTLLVNIQMIETKMESLNIPKYKLKGTSIIIDHHAQYFPRAYKHVPMSTIVMIAHGSDKWFLQNIWRGYTRKPFAKYQLTLPTSLKEELVEYALKPFIFEGFKDSSFINDFEPYEIENSMAETVWEDF